MNTILFCVLVAIGFVVFVFLGWSFWNWIDGYKDAGVRISFGEFRRIYELAPSKWDRYSDYTYRRREWISNYEKREEAGTYISTSIAMKTLFDFWRLLLWQKEITRKSQREKRFKKEKASLKSLSIIIEKMQRIFVKNWKRKNKKPRTFDKRLLID